MSAFDNAASSPEDATLAVVWEKPDGRGGWITEASCWVEGCHVRIEGYDRLEVNWLMLAHQEGFHGNA